MLTVSTVLQYISVPIDMVEDVRVLQLHYLLPNPCLRQRKEKLTLEINF